MSYSSQRLPDLVKPEMLNGELLRARRQAKNLSQGALGKLIEKDGQYISKLERGILHGMTVETLERLADVLDCTTDELLGRSKPKAAKAAAEGGVRATARS